MKSEKRMYFLTMYQLIGIQIGIQAGHACNEYTQLYWNDDDFQDWSKNWKTWIILNGGTSNDGSPSADNISYPVGTMETHYQFLLDNSIKCAKFHEPDLNNALSAIAFLVDEKVFNKVLYPDFYIDKLESDMTEDELIEYKEWCVNIGKENVILRQWLSPRKPNAFRLA
jgi:hypothetical protein